MLPRFMLVGMVWGGVVRIRARETLGFRAPGLETRARRGGQGANGDKIGEVSEDVVGERKVVLTKIFRRKRRWRLERN